MLQAINWIDDAIDATDYALDIAGEVTDKALDAIEATFIIGFALLLVGAYQTYKMGVAFSVWCDRLVGESMESTGYEALETALDEWIATTQEKVAASREDCQAAYESWQRAANPLEELSIRELKQLARTDKIKGYGKMTKSQLIAAL